MLTLEGLKEIQAVGIAFNLINIRVADLRNGEQEGIRISYDEKAVVSSTGLPIKFTAVSALSYEPSFTLANALYPTTYRCRWAFKAVIQDAEVYDLTRKITHQIGIDISNLELKTLISRPVTNTPEMSML